jgi:hypothetical protein
MWKWTQRSFAGGQQDLTLRGRQDLASYFTSAKTLENFLVKRQGCISKRRGTNLVASLGGLFGEGKTITHARIIPFVYERSGGYMLLFASDGESSKMFVLSNRGILLSKTRTKEGVDPEVSITWSDVYPIAEHVDDEGYTNTYATVATDVPYAGDALNAIGYSQSGDTLFVAHSDTPFATIKRTGEDTFVYEPVDFAKMGASTAYLPPRIIASKDGTEGGGSTRSISYVATYVKDGVESAPSTPVFVSYKMPWASSFHVAITVSKGDNAEEPDFYNIYKKTAGDYGFIGATNNAYVGVKPDANDVVLSNLNDDTSAIKIGSYAVNIGNNKYNPVVSRGAFVMDKNGVMSKLFEGSRIYSWPSGSSKYGGIVNENGGIKIAFNKAVAFTDVSFLFGLASFGQHSYSYDYHSINAWGLVYEAFAGGDFIVKLCVRFGGQTTTNVYSQTGSVGVSNDAVLCVHQTRKKLPNGAVTHHPTSSGELEDILNRTSVRLSFREQIEKDLPAGKDFVVEYLSIEPKTSGASVAITDIELLYNAKDTNFITDDYITPDTTLTPPNNEPHFHKDNAYPATVALYNQRLALAATNEQPFTLWMSVTGDLYNFNTHASIREDDAIEATVPATEFPEINHIVASKEMLLMCDNGEWVVSPVSGNTLSYSTIQIKQQSQIGCSKRLPPLAVADEILFAESTNETLRAIRYDFTSDGYQSTDLSVLSQSLTRNNPIVDYAYKQHPDSIVVCVREDGTLATLTYMKEHELCAWSTTVLGGGLKAVGVCTDKAIRNGTTDLYILAKNTSGEHLLLRVREDAPVDTVEHCLCLDAMRIVEATETPILGDGEVAINMETGDAVEAPTTGSRYAIGYPYAATFRSIPPEAQGESTIQFEIKGAKSIELRLENASKFRVIPSALEHETGANYWTTCGDDVTVSEGKVTFHQQDHIVDLAGDANTSGAVTIQSDSVWPVSVLSYSINFEFDPRLLGQKG